MSGMAWPQLPMRSLDMVSNRSRALAHRLGTIGFAAVLLLLGQAPVGAVTNSFIQTNLLSNNGVPGTDTDRKLVNPWGIAFFPDNPLWVNDQGTGVSELFDGKGNII